MARSTRGAVKQKTARTKTVELEHDGVKVSAECRGLTVRAARMVNREGVSQADSGFDMYEQIVVSLTIDGEEVDPQDLEISFLEPLLSKYNEVFGLDPSTPAKT